MEERDSVQHWFPLVHLVDVEEVLLDLNEGSLQAGLDALRWLVGELE